MIAVFWMAASILTTVLWFGTMFLVVGRILRNYSDLLWPQFIASSAGISLLWASAIRVSMNTSGGAYWLYGFLSVCSVFGLSLAVPRLVEYVWDRKPILFSRVFHYLLVTLVTLTSITGVFLRFPLIIAIADGVVTVLILGTTTVLLLGIRRMEPRKVRLRTAIVCSAAIVVSITELARIYFWQRSLDPFGVSLPPLGLLFFLSGLILGLFIRGLRGLRITFENTCSELDPVAVREYGISERELEIVHLICSGESNDMIASRLFISVSTVKNHVYHIFRKTGCHSRIEMINKLSVGQEG